MFFNKGNKDEQLALICDIGSGSVGAGLVAFRKNRSPEIVYSVRSPIVFQENIDFSLFKRSMISSLEGVVNKAVSEGPKKANEFDIKNKKIQKAFVVFSSPWYIAHTKTLNISSPKTIEFSENFVETKINDEIAKFSDSQKLNEKKEFESGLELIEHQLIDIKLNGYSLSDPYGKKADDVDMTLFMSVISKNLKEEVSDVLSGFLHIDDKDVTFHTFAISSYSFIRDHFDNVDDYLIVDVSAEVTDIFVSDDGKLTSSSSYPYGTNSLIRSLISVFQISASEAKHSLSMYRSDDLETAQLKKMSSVLNSAQSKWSELLTEAIDDMTLDFHPQKIFIIAEKPFEFVFNQFLNERTLVMQIDKNLEVVSINNSFFSNAVKANENSDMYIASESYYANKLLYK